MASLLSSTHADSLPATNASQAEVASRFEADSKVDGSVLVSFILRYPKLEY
jgi:hypothetical protein